MIKAGPFAGVTQTDVVVPLDFDITLAIALLATNAVATLMILHKAWYHTYLLHIVKANFNQDVSYTNENFPDLPRLDKSCLFL